MRNLVLIFLIAFSQQNFSQIVNVENQRLSAKKEGFSGSIDANLNYSVNTKSLLQFSSRLNVAYLKKRQYILLLGDHSLVRSGNESFINKGFQHLRYNYTLKDSGRVIYEAYQQIQFNKVQRINSRLLLGTGFRFMLIDQKNYQLNIGTGLMGEYEDLTDAGISADLLSANYISFDGQFFENFGLNFITYMQPKLIDRGNYRLSNETTLRVKINSHLTVKVIYSIAHDSRDIVGVRKTNYALRNALSFNF